MTEQSEAESRFDLPQSVAEPFEVYVNGIPQQAGVDYEVVERMLVFSRALVAEVKMSRIQWFLVSIGIGSYRKHDSVDIAYEYDGRRLVASGLTQGERDT